MLFVPGFIFGALVANYLFDQYAIYPTPDKETNVVVACMLGIIVTLLARLVMDETFSNSGGLPRPPPPVQARLKRPRCRAAKDHFALRSQPGTLGRTHDLSEG
jgi:hypothetical protein